ncbi:hypothetical protein B0H14DRAFT_3495600 [Mycena olivaceomarginata]|nr:hypothetical protein B0H14DRAFT_3495600 [Mycena olivaceomarginata]
MTPLLLPPSLIPPSLPHSSRRPLLLLSPSPPSLVSSFPLPPHLVLSCPAAPCQPTAPSTTHTDQPAVQIFTPACADAVHAAWPCLAGAHGAWLGPAQCDAGTAHVPPPWARAHDLLFPPSTALSSPPPACSVPLSLLPPIHLSPSSIALFHWFPHPAVTASVTSPRHCSLPSPSPPSLLPDSDVLGSL